MARGEIRRGAPLQVGRRSLAQCRGLIAAVLGAAALSVTGCARQETAQASDSGQYAFEAPVVTVRTLPLRSPAKGGKAAVNEASKSAAASESRPRRRRRSRPRPRLETPPQVRPTTSLSTEPPRTESSIPVTTEQPGLEAPRKKPDAPTPPPAPVTEPPRDAAPTPAPEPKAPTTDG